MDRGEDEGGAIDVGQQHTGDESALSSDGEENTEEILRELDVAREEEEDEEEEEEEEDDDDDGGEPEETTGRKDRRVFRQSKHSEYAFLWDFLDDLPKQVNESREFGPSLNTNRGDGPWANTATLLLVISVKIAEGAGKYIFGKILVRATPGYTYLYNRDSSQCERLGKEAVATLTGPYRSVHLWLVLAIYLDLFVKDTEYSEGKELSRGSILYWPCSPVYDGLFAHVVPGKYGSAKVTYAVIENGVEAVVGLNIIDMSAKDLPAKVTAFIRKYRKQEIVLFDGILGDVEPVPLSRSVLAVPMDQSWMLEIIVALGPDESEASYTCRLTPKLHSSNQIRLESKYGTVVLNVQWSCVD